MKLFKYVLIAGLTLGLAAPAYAALDAKKVQHAAEGAFQAYLADHKTITEIESPTGDLGGSKKMAEWLKKEFEPLGYTVEFRQNDKGTHTIVQTKGKGKLRILLLGHTDTVQPVGSLAKQPYHYDKDSGLAKGPGVGDSKASVAQLLYFAKLAKELKFDNFASMTFYFDAEEETGSETEEKILGELSAINDVCLSVDSAPLDWGLTTQRKWVINYEIEVTGQTGHAGNRPQASASATVELVNQLSRIMALASPLPGEPADYTSAALKAKGIEDRGQFIPEISINVGVIKTGNTKVNSIPADAYAKLDIRGFKPEDLPKIGEEIQKIAASPTIKGTTVTAKSSNMMPAMAKTAEVQKMVDEYSQIVKKLYGADTAEWVAGGVTIGNFTSHHIPTLDGLGIETDRSHDLENERASLNSVAPRITAMVLLLDQLIEKDTIQSKK